MAAGSVRKSWLQTDFVWKAPTSLLWWMNCIGSRQKTRKTSEQKTRMNIQQNKNEKLWSISFIFLHKANCVTVVASIHCWRTMWVQLVWAQISKCLSLNIWLTLMERDLYPIILCSRVRMCFRINRNVAEKSLIRCWEFLIRFAPKNPIAKGLSGKYCYINIQLFCQNRAICRYRW